MIIYTGCWYRETKLSCIVHMANGTATYANRQAVSYKCNHNFTMLPSNPTPRYVPPK